MSPTSRAWSVSAWCDTHKLLLAAGLGLVFVFGITSGVHADRGQYVVHSFTEPANSGFPVSKPLDEFRAVARVRVVVPAEWRRLKAGSGQRRFVDAGRGCRYRVTFAVNSQLAGPRDAAEYVADALPSPGTRSLLDSGRRGSAAFRVILNRSRPVVQISALWAAVLTRRSDIAPPGQVAWSELSVAAASRRGDECHSGTWRDRLGPQIGDALATARTRLDFIRRRWGPSTKGHADFVKLRDTARAMSQENVEMWRKKIDTRVATAADLEGLTITLTAAFEHDPLWTWVFPDPKDLAVYWRFCIGSALRYPCVWIIGDYAAASVWIPPEGTELTEKE
jgi:hypothetical protein